MANNPLVDVAMAATLLKATAPQQFAQLCEAVRALELQAIFEMTAGDEARDVFRAQGKVKTLQQLRKHLVECNELRDTFTRRA